MLYVGRGLQAPQGGTEPAQIDPTLKVAVRNVPTSDAQMGYWPEYDTISPEARAGYLKWLAGGRGDPNADIGFVFLFLYGLERRALVDVPADKRLNSEVPYLREEVARLLRVYEGSNSFKGYATSFLNVLDLQAGQDSATTSTPPALMPEFRWEAPLRLRVGLGWMAADRKPIPAEWASAWAWYHPEIYLRTPATRCTEEFQALFESRYKAAYGDGIVVKPGRTTIEVEYYPSSSGIGAAELSIDVPDVLTIAAPTKQLREIAESVTADLDAYSRFLGRNPEGKGSIAAAALLPADLAGEPGDDVKALLDWGTRHADAGAAASGEQLLELWPAKVPGKLAKAEAVTLATLFGRHGLGLEPDVRLGGPAITNMSKVIVFRTGADTQPQTATPSYASAATLLHLATAVAAADGTVSAEEQETLVHHLEAALELTPGERVRLEAHMRWLDATGVKLTGLTRRVEVLTETQRMSIGDLLVAVAAADGVISSEEVTSLTKIFKLLGLDPTEVHSRLHALLTGGRPAPARRPVTVREAGAQDPGYPITPPAAEPDALGNGAVAGVGFVLDADVIRAKFAETAAVGALLADIFKEDEADHAGTGTGAPNSPAAAAPVIPPFAGLDAAHSHLIRALLLQPTWTRGQLEELAEKHQLMPDGAIDIINEFALDVAGEPLLDEDEPDTFTINEYARQELPA